MDFKDLESLDNFETTLEENYSEVVSSLILNIMSSKRNMPSSPLKALKKAMRDEDIELHGKQTVFRKTITKNKKKYDRRRRKRDCEEI